MADEKPQKYRVKSQLRMDGKDYAIGTKIILSALEAQAIGADVLELMVKEEK